jgi:DNA helicase-2/ATP-dependent DNA helicase PcrA
LASIDSDIDLRSFIDELRKQIGMPEVPMEAPFVRIMSLHKSKGLSANLVVIAGLVDGLIPRTPRGDMNPEYLEEHFREQRRVLFVGVTRTRQTLVLSKFQKIDSRAAHISGAQTGRWAGRGIKTTIASRFLGEFGPSLPRAIRGDRWEYQ